MDLKLKHCLNVIKHMLGREPEELLKAMPSDDIIKLGQNILNLAGSEIHELYGYISTEFRVMGDANVFDMLETIKLNIEERRRSFLIYNDELRDFYIYILSYMCLTIWGNRTQRDEFVENGTLKGGKDGDR